MLPFERERDSGEESTAIRERSRSVHRPHMAATGPHQQRWPEAKNPAKCSDFITSVNGRTLTQRADDRNSLLERYWRDTGETLESYGRDTSEIMDALDKQRKQSKVIRVNVHLSVAIGRLMNSRERRLTE